MECVTAHFGFTIHPSLNLGRFHVYCLYISLKSKHYTTITLFSWLGLSASSTSLGTNQPQISISHQLNEQPQISISHQLNEQAEYHTAASQSKKSTRHLKQLVHVCTYSLAAVCKILIQERMGYTYQKQQ
jgi:hypothetical protein